MIKRVWLYALLCAGPAFFFAAAASAETVRLVADPWCPYNCNPDNDQPGFMVEIAQRVFQESGYQVEYHLRPWLRALQDARNGEFHGVIGATRSEAPNFIFPDLAQGKMAMVFWTLGDSTWQYQDVKSLENQYVAVIAGYSYGGVIMDLLRNEQHRPYVTELHGESPLENGLAMLERGRIQVLLEDEHVMRFDLLLGMNTEDSWGLLPPPDRDRSYAAALSPARRSSPSARMFFAPFTSR